MTGGLAQGNTLGEAGQAAEGIATLGIEFAGTAPSLASSSVGAVGKGSGKFAAPVTGAPTQIHHIATNKGRWRTTFEVLFGRAGVSLEDAANTMKPPGHAGRHTEAYHRYVFSKLSSAIEGKSGEEAKKAFVRALDRLRKELEQNPRLPYRDGGLSP